MNVCCNPSPYTPSEVLDKLIAAGLGDVSDRRRITPEQFRRAMLGETVKPKTRHQFGSGARLTDRPGCPNCGKDECRVIGRWTGWRRWKCRACWFSFRLAIDSDKA